MVPVAGATAGATPTDELVSIVSCALETRGVLAKIRAELRANVFTAIHEQQGVDGRGDGRGDGKRTDAEVSPALARLQRSLVGRLALQLVHELLISANLDYTASVFAPEAAVKGESPPDRQLLCDQLQLPHVGSEGGSREPLLVSLLRLHLDGANAPARAAAAAGAPPNPAGPWPSPGAAPLWMRRSHAPSKAPSKALEPLVPLKPLRVPRSSAAASAVPVDARNEEAEEAERRLDALESKLASLAGLGTADELLADEIKEEIEEEIEEESVALGEDETQLEVPFGESRLGASDPARPHPYPTPYPTPDPPLGGSDPYGVRFEKSGDESTSPTRLGLAMKGFDHTEDVRRP